MSLASERRQSAIIVPVPEAEPFVGRFRLACDPLALAGVPPHITLMVPWLPAESIGPADRQALSETLAATRALDFTLARVGWFGSEVLWLAPEPAGPFIDLTARLAERFHSRPYGGAFDHVVPHLTVGRAGDGVDLVAAVAGLEPSLPIPCRAKQAWVMVGVGKTWEVIEKVSFG